MYAVDEDELGVEGGEYSETGVIYDDNEIYECRRWFFDFMNAELHKKYDLRSRKRSRTQ